MSFVRPIRTKLVTQKLGFAVDRDANEHMIHMHSRKRKSGDGEKGGGEEIGISWISPTRC